MIINILDKNTERIVDFLQKKDTEAPVFWDELLTEQIFNGVTRFEFSTTSDASDYLINKNKLVVKHPHGHFLAFIIEDVEQTSDREIYVKAEADHMRLRTSNYIEPVKLEGATVNTAADYALSGTKWKRGITEHSGTLDFKIDEHKNPLQVALQVANDFDLEIRFRTEVASNRIVGRFVDYLKRIGVDDGGETVTGKDLVHVKRKESSGEVYTAMYGVGKGQNPGEYITFESINGGKKYIEDKDALQRWSDDGEHLYGIWFVEPEEEEELTPEMVLFRTKQAFKDNIDSKYSYEVEHIALEQFGYTLDTVRLGNTRRIKDPDFNPPLYLEARVKKLEWSNSFKEVKTEFGNYREIVPSTYDTLRNLQKKLFKTNFNTVKKIFSDTPPTDKSVIWVDTSGNFLVPKLYDEDIEDWRIMGATEAHDLNAYEVGDSLVLGGENNSELNIYRINSDGEPEKIGEVIGDAEASFKTVRTDNLIAPNVLYTMPIDENLFPAITYYVNPVNGDDSFDGLTAGTPKRTIQAILNKLPRYLSGDITIRMEATGTDQQEDLELKGFGGDGIIRITSESGYKTLEGKVSIRHCTNQIFFSGLTMKCPSTTDIHVKVETCSKVEFRNVKFLGENKADDGVRSYYSKTSIIDCEAYRYNNAAFTSAISNHMLLKNNKGSNNKYGCWAYDGGIITGGGTCPTGTTSQTRETYGHILCTFTNDGGTTPTDPPTTTQTVTKYFNATDSGAWRQNYGGQWYQNTPYQGKWNSWGLYKGLWFHGTQLSVLNGKNIIAMKAKVKRDNEGGNGNINANVVFRTHNYSSQPGGEPALSGASVTEGFKWNDEEWVDITPLKSAFENGTAKGIGIYTTSTSNNNYAIFTGSCQIKVTYEE